MRTIRTALVATGLTILAGGAALAQQQPFVDGVKVEHAAARLVVVAEPRSNVSVTIAHGPSALPPLQVRREGGVIVVDGGLARPFGFGGGGDRIRCIGGANAQNGAGPFARDTRAVQVEGVGRVNYRDLPVITAHVPLNAHIADEGAVWGQIGPSDGLHLSTVGCGDWTAGPVRGELDVYAAGSGDITVDRAGQAKVSIAGSSDLRIAAISGQAALSMAGSGDVRTGPVGGALKATMAGSGDIDIARVQAPVEAHIAGSGGVRIHGGDAPDMRVDLASSGDFTFDGVAGRLSASVVGSGDVRVARVTGEVNKSVMGSGEVQVGH